MSMVQVVAKIFSSLTTFQVHQVSTTQRSISRYILIPSHNVNFEQLAIYKKIMQCNVSMTF